MTSGNFPKTADIVIIGGGAVGTATLTISLNRA